MIRVLNKMEEGTLAFLLVTMTLLVFSEVIMRFVFGTGSLWIQELTLHMSAWFVLFGASYGIKIGAHIGVDAVVRLLPDKIHRIVSVIAILACLVYCALYLFGSWEYLLKMWQIGIAMEDLHVPGWIAGLFSDDFAWDVLRIDFEDPKVPLWFAHGILIIGFGLMVIRLLVLLQAVIKGDAMGFQFADEAKESMHLAEEGKAALNQQEGHKA